MTLEENKNELIAAHDIKPPSLSNFADRKALMLMEAMSYAKIGLPIFPVSPVPGLKRPLIAGGFKSATKDEDIIFQWYNNIFPGAMIGLPTGQLSRIVVIDIDMKNGKNGQISLEEWESKHGTLPPTMVVETPSGGYHAYYALPEGITIPSGVNVIGEGVDVRGDGGYVVAACSINESCETYNANNFFDMAPAPQFLLDFLSKPKKSEGQQICTGENSLFEQGSRNTGLFRAACKMYGLGVRTREALLDTCLRLNESLCRPPLPESEVISIITSVLKYDPPYSHDNMGNADRFADYFHRDVKHVEKQWMVFDGGVYKVDTLKKTQQMAKQIALVIEDEYKRAAQKGDDAIDKDIVKSLKSLSKKTKDQPFNMLNIAASDPRISAEVADFDTEDHLLNCKNGILDLDSLEFIEHDPSYLFTKQTNASFLPEVKSELWEKFLDDLTSGDQDFKDFLARLFGGVGTYGGNVEQVFCILLGDGANGKSIFNDAIRHVMGSYSDILRQEILTASGSNNIKHDIADIAGARFLQASEPPVSNKLNASLIKELTGGDMIKGRHIYQHSVKFTCKALISLVTNWELSLEAGDDALKRRILVLKFNNVIPREQRDPLLSERLKEENNMNAILSWLIEGRKEYLDIGLSIPERVRKDTDAFNKNMDFFENFIASECEIKTGEKVQANFIYYAYSNYMSLQQESKNALGKNQFFKLLRRKFSSTKINGCVYYHGIRLIKSN